MVNHTVDFMEAIPHHPSEQTPIGQNNLEQVDQDILPNDNAGVVMQMTRAQLQQFEVENPEARVRPLPGAPSYTSNTHGRPAKT